MNAPVEQAAAVMGYLDSKRSGMPTFAQNYGDYGSLSGDIEQRPGHIRLYDHSTGTTSHMTIDSLYKPVHVDHSHKCDSILAKIIYAHA